MSVTVFGGSGNPPLVFNVSGSAADNYASDFSGAVGSNPPAITTLSDGSAQPTVPGALNIVYSGGPVSDYNLTSPDQYTYVSVGDPTTIGGSTAGDTLFGGAALTYIESATGHNNRVVFTDGNNEFIGSKTGGTGDTIAGGSGYDTIMTGGGPSTVFSGSGHTLIETNDTVAGDVVVMSAGNTTVDANGVSDTVFASATGTIFGGTGTLTFTTAASTSPLAVTIVGGSGTTNAFGSAGTDLTLGGGGTATYIAGAGNETLNGFNSGGFSFFGDTTPGDTASDTVVGGAGFDYFSTGAGTEFFQAGTGTDSFNIASIDGGANITIADFGGADSVSFFTGADSVGSSDGTNYTVTLSDGTHVEFLGITSLSGHIT
jgi:hypothetical protein